ncbi:hypothetical protein G4B88_029202 [Cannabis sativa]|uniref:Uncharacterized protein n=1 Tax=Cannabis sativa TaxID=3483 RepID=A0A7J6H102_CANSA|nr:hypothetical protein G4B88_029202 [Cannabis sativa]
MAASKKSLYLHNPPVNIFPFKGWHLEFTESLIVSMMRIVIISFHWGIHCYRISTTVEDAGSTRTLVLTRISSVISAEGFFHIANTNQQQNQLPNQNHSLDIDRCPVKERGWGSSRLQMLRFPRSTVIATLDQKNYGSHRPHVLPLVFTSKPFLKSPDFLAEMLKFWSENLRTKNKRFSSKNGRFSLISSHIDYFGYGYGYVKALVTSRNKLFTAHQDSRIVWKASRRSKNASSQDANVMVDLYKNGLVTDCLSGENKGRILSNDFVYPEQLISLYKRVQWKRSHQIFESQNIELPNDIIMCFSLRY